jgi:hypothetical protein
MEKAKQIAEEEMPTDNFTKMGKHATKIKK